MSDQVTLLYPSSSPLLASQARCAETRLHICPAMINAVGETLEPVDEHDRPVRPGQLSQAVLVTNLANRAQPIIRYKMDDRVAISPGACLCGSPFPALHVIGRTGDILSFPAPQDATIQILPLAILPVAEEMPGAYSCQIIKPRRKTPVFRPDLYTH